MTNKVSKDSLYNLIPNRFTIMHLFQVYLYTKHKNILISEGYALDKKDKEDVFIEIITENNPDTISLLENFLENFEKIQVLGVLYRSLEPYLSNYDEKNDEDITEFLLRFN